MNQPIAKTCIIYCRVSSKEQVNGTSLETQERLCREYASSQGWQILEVFIELGESAKTAEREQFSKAINFCCLKKSRVSYFVVYKLDRFSRRVSDHMKIRVLLQKAGTELRAVNDPINESPTGKLMETVMAGFAEFDNNVRTERTKEGMRQRVQEGYWVWTPPLGYYKPARGKKTNIVPEPNLSLLVRAGFEEYAKGGRTYKTLASYWTRLGLRTKRGNPIKPQEVQKMIRNPVYYGVIKAFGGEWPGGFEPIITRSLFLACQGTPGTPSSWAVPRATDNPTFPLRKLARCSGCGASITGSVSRSGNRSYPYYHHTNKQCAIRKTIPKSELEKAFLEFLISIEIEPQRMRLFKAVIVDIWKTKHKSLDNQKIVARNAVQKLEQEKNKIFELHREGVYSNQDFQEQRAIIARKLEEKYSILEEPNGESFDIEKAFEYCWEYASKPAKTWFELEGNYQARIRFQKLILRERVPFDGKKFGTTVLSPIFQQKGTLLLEESLLVAPQTVIMNLFGLGSDMVTKMRAWNFEVHAWLAKEPIQEKLAVTY